MAEFTFEILNENAESDELKIFLESCGNCTIFHRPLFLSYHDQNKFSKLKNFRIFHLIFRDRKNKIKAFLPGAFYDDEDNRKLYKTPFYSSYGGIVFDDELQYIELENITGQFIECVKSNEACMLSFSQTADSYCGKFKEKNNYLKYILKVKGFEISSIDMLMVKRNSDDFNENFHNTITRQINQALKNKLEFKTEPGVDPRSYELLVKSQTRLGGKLTHSYEELEKISRQFPDSVFTFKTISGGELVAGITALKCNNEVLNTFYIYDDEDKRDLKGMQFTYFNVFKFANENGFKFTDLGPATFGLEPHTSLITYKEKYGIFPDLRITYTKSFD